MTNSARSAFRPETTSAVSGRRAAESNRKAGPERRAYGRTAAQRRTAEPGEERSQGSPGRLRARGGYAPAGPGAGEAVCWDGDGRRDGAARDRRPAPPRNEAGGGTGPGRGCPAGAGGTALLQTPHRAASYLPPATDRRKQHRRAEAMRGPGRGVGTFGSMSFFCILLFLEKSILRCCG